MSHHEHHDQQQPGTVSKQTQAGESAGKLASGPPPAVERASVQKSYGRQASGPPPAAPQTTGRRGD
jgi:hypothetical protein